MPATNGSTILQIKLTTDGQGNVTAALDQVEQKLRQIKQPAEEAHGAIAKMAETLEQVKKVAEAWGLYEIAKKVVEAFAEANAEVARLQSTLIAVTGSATAAKAAFEQIEEVSRSSPANVDELTGAWVRLQNVGIKPTAELLHSLAATAVATNSDVTTVANAFAMAAEGHARGLTALGIETKDVGDKVLVSFQGQQTVIEHTKEGITEYLAELGKSPAALEAMDAKLKSAAGRWDQLKKAADEFFASAGNAGATGGSGGLFAGMLQGAASTVDELTEVTKAYGLTGLALAEFRLKMYALGGAEGYQSLVKGAREVNAEHAALKPVLEEITGLYVRAGAAALGMAGDESSLGGAASKLWDQLKNVPAQVQAKIAEESKKGDGYTEQLEAQARALGANTEAAAKYRTTLGDLKDLEQSAKDKIIESARAVDIKTASLKSAAEYQARLTADNKYIEALQQQVDTFGATNDVLTLYKGNVQAAAAVDQAHADAIRAKSQALADLQQHQNDVSDLKKQIDAEQKVQDALDAVIASVDKVAAAQDKYEKAVRAVTAAREQGLISQAKEIELVNGLIKARDEEINTNHQWEQGMHTLLEGVGSDLSGLLGDFMANGIKDAQKKVLAESQNLFKQLSEFWIKQKLVIPLQQQIEGKGPGPAGGDLAATGIALAGGAVGGAVGGKTGGFIAGAASGAVTGLELSGGNPYGAVIGAIIGGIMGALGSSSDKTPSFQIGGKNSGDPAALNGGKFSDYLGTFGLRGKHITDDLQRQIESAIGTFDDTLANLIPPNLIDQVRNRVQAVNTSFTGSSPEAVEKAHLDAVMDVVTPELKAFVDGLTSVQDRLKAFTSLLKLKDEFDALNSAIVQISGTPIQKVLDTLKNLDKGVTDAQDKLTAAIKTQDPTQILTAEQTLKQAVLGRYQQEIQLVQQIQQSLQNLASLTYSLNLNIAQKIAAITGDQSGVIATSGAQVTSLRNSIGASTDPAEILSMLGDFTSALDTWLSSSIQAVNDALNAQITDLEAQKNDLQSQAAAESAAAQRQASAASATQAAYAAAANAARQAEISALQDQLNLAKQWQGVLDHTAQTVQAITTGNTNPLGGYAQAAALESIISQAVERVAGEGGETQAKDADALVTNLQQRLQLIQSGNLYDRSSPEYLAQYNRTLAQLAQVQALAGPKSQTDYLQAQLTVLQGMQSNTSSISTSSSASVTISAATQAKIDDLNKKEDALKQQAKEDIDKLNKQAVDYYTWAKGTAATAEETRHQELMDQLMAITGGVDPTAFIAAETQREVDLLTSINTNLAAFLASVSSGGSSVGGGSGGSAGSGGGGSGGGGGPISPTLPRSVGAGIAIHVTTNVTGTGMGPQDIADAVNAGLADALPQAVPQLKRMLKVA